MKWIPILVIGLFAASFAPSHGGLAAVRAQGICSVDYDDYIGTDPDQFTIYYTYDEITSRVHELADRWGEIELVNDDTAFSSDLEPTYEGRENWALKLSSDPSVEDPDKPDILFVGNHHAREWMSFSVPMYFLSTVSTSLEVVNGLSDADNDGDGLVNEDPFDGIDNDGDGEGERWDGIDNDCDGLIDEGIDEDWSETWVVSLLDRYEIYVVPMVNPDGYEYDRTTFSGEDAWNNNPQGGWRKNLRDNLFNGDIDRMQCDGVDLNRNYPYQWGGPHGQDPLNPCGPSSDIYGGPVNTADDDGDGVVDEDPWDGTDNDLDGLIDEDHEGGFSEPETRNVRTIVEGNDDDGDGLTDFVTAITFHSYSELVIYPWGYTNQEVANPHLDIFQGMAGAMASSTGYEAMQGWDLYPTSGDFDDTMWGKYGIYSFTIEIGNNFHEHPTLIEPFARRNMAPMFYMIQIADNPADAAASLVDQHTPTVVDLEVPARPVADETIRFTVEINGTLPSVKTFHYRTGSMEDSASSGREQGGSSSVDWSSWKSKPMSQGPDGLWWSEIDGQEALTQIEYYFEISTYTGGTSLSPDAGAREPYSMEVNFGKVSWSEIGSGWVVLILLFAIIYGLLTVALRTMLTAERTKMGD